MNNSEQGYGARLKEEVIDPGFCSVCGACVGFCPYIKTFGERVGVIHDCKVCEGVCYRVCPRSPTQYHVLRQEVFGASEHDPVFGAYKAICFARAGSEHLRSRGQYGGVVTALVTFALKQGIIDGALMTGGNFTKAIPTLVSSVSDALQCAGSKYTSSPTLGLFQEAVKEGYQKIGVVGRPCQITACRKIQKASEISGGKISLVIGLFCMGSLLPEFYSFLKDNHLDRYERMDIPKDILFQGAGGDVMIPFEDVRRFIRLSCLSCYDPLSELADVSVGSTEHDPGWNTLIVRTAKGMDMVEKARFTGDIETKAYPPDLLNVLTEAVFNRKKRVLECPESMYLDVPPREKDYFLTAGGDA